MSVRLEYGVARLRDFAVRTTTDKQGKSHVETVELLGEPVRPSKRF